ncbi:MAG: hypothetical protein M3R01_10630, partial [Actinomycetota bacterium]|nr:hypothetical protein [Actinomycetota bacterium]
MSEHLAGRAVGQHPSLVEGNDPVGHGLDEWHVVLLDEPAAGIAQREVEALAPLLRRLRDEAGASLV